MKVWIDLSNSPHPLLFEPIAQRLEELGHGVCVTARDNAQTVELARERWPAVEVIGGPSPGGGAAKGRALFVRVAALSGWARSARPDVALSHGSYAQIVAARMIGMPAVTAMDYEHQPANHLSFRLASRLLLPAALEEGAVRRYGATPRKTHFYHGLKEDLYVGRFRPNPQIVEELGVQRRPGERLVVARTPPSGALYHRFENDLFIQTLRVLGRQGDVRCIVLARRPQQREAIRALAAPNITVPGQAVDSRSLMYAADLVIGAGGTMTREAAVLGVPTVSVFAGRVPAVDRWLEQRGRLRRIQSADAVLSAFQRRRPPRDLAELEARGERLTDEFVASVVELHGSAPAELRPIQAHG